MKAVIYARISREEQSMYSLDQQVKECRDLIEKEGHTLVDTYIDDGWSAKDMNRPELQRMLQEIESKKFQLIVIWKLDRLTRSTLDGLTLVETFFRPNGIQFASKTEDIDTTTSDGYMMFTIRLSMAQAEREKIRDRSAMGHIARAKSGKRVSNKAPYGYDLLPDLFLEVNEFEAEVVKLIFNLFLEGNGKMKIARFLNDRNVSTKTGSQWHERTVHWILTNPTYYGATHWKRRGRPETDRIIVENTHEAIIPKDLWLKAQDYLNRRKDHHNSQSSYDFPFSTVVKCGVCGRSLHGRYECLKGPYPPTRHYRCSGYYKLDRCMAPGISERKLVELFFRSINFYFDQDLNPNEPVDKSSPDVAKERKRIQKELEKSKERLVKLAKAMASGDLDFDIYAKLREEEKDKAAKLEAALDELHDTAEPDAKRLGEIAEEIRNMSKLWHTWDLSKQKLEIQRMFKRIVVAKVNGVWQIEEVEVHA